MPTTAERTASSASQAPTATPAVEIWIRTVGSRRQAFSRPVQPEGQRTRNWHAIQVAKADKALRTGKLDMGLGIVLPVVSRETDDAAAHPMAADFARQASALSRTIDSLSASAGGAA